MVSDKMNAKHYRVISDGCGASLLALECPRE